VEAELFFDPELQDEPSPPGCRIAITHPGEAVNEELKRRGIDLNSVNVIAPPDASFSVYFSESGQVDGWSGIMGSEAPAKSALH
jgi:hypothetical protein